MAMRRSTRMMLGRAAAEERRMPRGTWREPIRMGDYEMESRFRDRRGREHYNNGRFAPMARGYGPYAQGYEGPFDRTEMDGDDMRPIGFNARWDDGPRMTSDATMPRHREMDRLPGNRPMMGGYMAGETDYPKMDEQTAMHWARNMHNEDGTKGPHWSMDQVRQVMNQKGVDCELPEFFAVMNSLYSDYDPILKKHNASNIDLYVDMAKAWIRDKDAVPNKAMAYYECVVRK